MTILKTLHVLFVFLSLTGFLLRLFWRWRRPQRLQLRWVRVLPHVNDTALLATGLAMVVRYHWWPWQQPWLAAKLLALLVYIVLGAVALRRGSGGAAVAALAVFAYIVAVALGKQVVPV